MTLPAELLAGMTGLLGIRPKAAPGVLGGKDIKDYAPNSDPSFNDHSTRDKWMALLGGLSPALAPLASHVIRSDQARTLGHDTDQLQKRRLAEAQSMGLSPRETQVYLLNPEEWSKQTATRYAASDLAGGSTRAVLGEQSSYTAPKTEKFDDRFGTVGSDGQVSYSAPRDPTYAEQTARNKPENVAPGGRLVSQDGKVVYAAPDRVEMHGFPATDNVYTTGGDGGGQASGGSRGARNNNPLNLTNLPNGAWDGQTGTDGRFAVFASPEAGFAAADKNLQAYHQHHGINTVAGIVSRWAPSNENDTRTYIQTVSHDLGVDPNAPLPLDRPEVRQAVLKSMSKVELGGSPPAQAGGPKMIQAGQAAAKAQTRPATAEEKRAYGIPETIPAQMKADGSIDVINGVGTNTKPIPGNIMTTVADSRSTLKMIDEAEAAIRGNPEALGWGNAFGDFANQRHDPKGIHVRAKLANIASQVRHDRSGAAVTISEDKFLRPFIPAETDTPEAAMAKLSEMRGRIQSQIDATAEEFGPDSGYRQLSNPHADASGRIDAAKEQAHQNWMNAWKGPPQQAEPAFNAWWTKQTAGGGHPSDGAPRGKGGAGGFEIVGVRDH